MKKIFLAFFLFLFLLQFAFAEVSAGQALVSNSVVAVAPRPALLCSLVDGKEFCEPVSEATAFGNALSVKPIILYNKKGEITGARYEIFPNASDVEAVENNQDSGNSVQKPKRNEKISLPLLKTVESSNDLSQQVKILIKFSNVKQADIQKMSRLFSSENNAVIESTDFEKNSVIALVPLGQIDAISRNYSVDFISLADGQKTLKAKEIPALKRQSAWGLFNYLFLR